MPKRKPQNPINKRHQDWWIGEIGKGRGVGRRPQDGEFLPDERVGGLVGEDMGRPDVRDAVVRHATFSDSWEEVLSAVFSRDQSQAVVVVSPSEYLQIANGSIRYPEGQLVLVDGDVQVPRWRTEREQPLKFPKAVIKGCLEIFDARNLKEIDCVITGWLSLTDCHGLESVRGEVFSNVSINKTDLSRLGADFRCGGNLAIFDCPVLRTLNCEATGGVTVVRSGLERTGPAFRSGVGVKIVNCVSLRELGGVVEDGVEIENRRVGGPVQAVDCRTLSVRGTIKARAGSIVRGLISPLIKGTTDQRGRDLKLSGRLSRDKSRRGGLGGLND